MKRERVRERVRVRIGFQLFSAVNRDRKTYLQVLRVRNLHAGNPSCHDFERRPAPRPASAECGWGVRSDQPRRGHRSLALEVRAPRAPHGAQTLHLRAQRRDLHPVVFLSAVGARASVDTLEHANTREHTLLSLSLSSCFRGTHAADSRRERKTRRGPGASVGLAVPLSRAPPLSRPSPRPYLASLVGAQTKSAPTLIRRSFPTSTPLLAFLLRKDFRPEMSLPFQSEEGEARPHRLLPLIAERARRPEEFFRGRRRRNGREDDRLLDWSRRTVPARIRPAFASAERSAPKRVSVRATEKRSSRRGADLRAFREKWKEGIGTRRCPHSSR